MSALLDGINKLKARLTATRAAYLDKLNVTGNVTSTDIWTNARATSVDTIAARMPASGNIPNSTQVVSPTDLTTARINKLDTIRAFPAIKPENGAFSHTGQSTISSSNIVYSSAIQTAFTADRIMGFRVASTNTTAAYASPNTLLSLTTSGYLYGCFLHSTFGGGATNSSVLLKVVADGATVFDSGAATEIGTSTSGRCIVAIGSANSTTQICLSPVPLRFNTSLSVQYAQSRAGHVQAVYLID